MVEKRRGQGQQRRQHVLMMMDQTADCGCCSAGVGVGVVACDAGQQRRVSRGFALVEYAVLRQTRRPSEHDRVNGRPEGYAQWPSLACATAKDVAGQAFWFWSD